jgi:hypothetical protein
LQQQHARAAMKSRGQQQLLACLLAATTALAACSYGDVQPGFQRCVQQCGVTGCSEPGVCVPSCAQQAGGLADDLSAALRAARWDCTVRVFGPCRPVLERAPLRPVRAHAL